MLAYVVPRDSSLYVAAMSAAGGEQLRPTASARAMASRASRPSSMSASLRATQPVAVDAESSCARATINLGVTAVALNLLLALLLN